MENLVIWFISRVNSINSEPNSDPPDCLSPAMTGMNIRDHWCSDGGAYWWHNNIAWGLKLRTKTKRENNLIMWEKIRLALENKKLSKRGLDFEGIDPNSFILEWLENLNNACTFAEIKPISTWIKQPMLIIGGLWDPHLKGAFDLLKRRSWWQTRNSDCNATYLDWWEGSQESLLNFSINT